MKLQARIEIAITEATGETAKLAGTQIAYGGCINNSQVISLQDGRRFFVKSHAKATDYPGMFACEFEALSLLNNADKIRVPVPLAYEDDFIILEAFEQGDRIRNWQELMGRKLALLHQATQNSRYGFNGDNYLGTTPQPNTWMDDWINFWREQRLGWQLELFSKKTTSDDPILRQGEKLSVQLDELLGNADEAGVLLHGDLWSGNAAADENGEPIIFDPASYYGQREAELGMMRMFGGFGPVCEAAYQEVWPLQAGADERIKLYRLYHELNHLNLFGRTYYDSCLTTMGELV